VPRHLDHLVLCVHDLEAAQRRFGAFGFTATPPADHPFGTRNRLVLLEHDFIELLTVADAGAVPPAAPGRFSFGAHNQAFLAGSEGMSMLAFQGTDARADVRGFAARGLDTCEPLDFSRAAILADGSTTRVAFSLAIATDARLPRLAFFTCQHHQSRNLLWQPDYQRHVNGARRIVEVIFAMADPGAHRHFFEQLCESDASVAPDMLSVGPAGNRVTLLGPDRLAARFPECTSDHGSSRFAAYRVAVADLGTLERQLRASDVAYRSAKDAIIIAPSNAFGVAIEFVDQTGE
jgi:hypothetical protein